MIHRTRFEPSRSMSVLFLFLLVYMGKGQVMNILLFFFFNIIVFFSPFLLHNPVVFLSGCVPRDMTCLFSNSVSLHFTTEMVGYSIVEKISYHFFDAYLSLHFFCSCFCLFSSPPALSLSVT